MLVQNPPLIAKPDLLRLVTEASFAVHAPAPTRCTYSSDNKNMYVNFVDNKFALAFYNAMGQSIRLTGVKYTLKLPGQQVKATPSPKLWAVCPWRATEVTHLEFLSQFGIPTALRFPGARILRTIQGRWLCNAISRP